MDRQSAGLDFAIIGHLESWEKIVALVNGMRDPGSHLSQQKIEEIYSFIPPRMAFHILAKSITGREARGAYIETFIPPNHLDDAHARTNLAKVKAAADCALHLGARVVSLGGFTSIALESNLTLLPTSDRTEFTTGNTLTAALIVKGVEHAVGQRGICLSDASILIIGATGDIGMACVAYFKDQCRHLMLHARNLKRLERLAQSVSASARIDHSVRLPDFVSNADIIICAASSSAIELNNVKPNALICDAGYPKNVDWKNGPGEVFLFHGGMGQLQDGYFFDPDYSELFYAFPSEFVTHGCVLESIILGLDGSRPNHSSGRGSITKDNIEKIWGIAQRHGAGLAPFFNNTGLLPLQTPVSIQHE
jgi:predicted amino acid dehydrogenase